MRIAILTVRNISSPETWTETYKENDGSRRGLRPEHADADVWARGIIEFYNETLQPHETRRELVNVQVIEAADPKKPAQREHDWHKTNLVTLEQRGQYFDRMECDRCGVTGKRFGLTHVKRDSKYRAKKYERCSQ